MKIQLTGRLYSDNTITIALEPGDAGLDTYTYDGEIYTLDNNSGYLEASLCDIGLEDWVENSTPDEWNAFFLSLCHSCTPLDDGGKLVAITNKDGKPHVEEI